MRRPPELLPLIVAATGALALAVGLVLLLGGRLADAAIALGGALLLLWSVLRARRA
jgi:hypothetical protein